MKGRIDAIISDAGSMDAGPYFLGTGTEYFEREAVKREKDEASKKRLELIDEEIDRLQLEQQPETVADLT